MKFFVPQDSIVRKIWGSGDTILFIFAGSAAEFALNKAVDWLYFTGRLPADPLGRLFSTVEYSRQIIFSEFNEANKSIDKIYNIHKAVEQQRVSAIPDWAYRDVLFMLIDYSIRSYELLQKKLTEEEKQEVFEVFYRVGERMQLKDLPKNYAAWIAAREEHLQNDLVYSPYTKDLYKQYKKHLGAFRYFLVKQLQAILVPQKVKQLLKLDKISIMPLILFMYKIFRAVKLDWFLKNIVLPEKYKMQVKNLDVKK